MNNMKKKICIVAEYMYCGGTEKSLLSLLPYLNRDKYEITLLLLKKKGDLLPELPKDINVYEIPLSDDQRNELVDGHTATLRRALSEKNILSVCKKIVCGIKMKIFSKEGCAQRLWYYKSIDKDIEKYPEKFDVVIDYMGYGLFNTYYAAYKVEGKAKISWIHFEPEEAIPDFKVFESVLKEFQHIMCVSAENKRQMIKMMPELANRFHLFYNILNVEELKKKATAENIVKENGEIVILSIGRLDSPKGFDIGINVVQRLYEKGYPVKWYIIGEGHQRTELEELINKKPGMRECIKLLGQKLNPYPYLEMCDIYFQPSRHEGYCIALAEARAFCKPIVASDFAGAKEQLINGETGLISSCDEEELYRSLERLLEDKHLCVELSKNLKKQNKNNHEQITLLEEILQK